MNSRKKEIREELEALSPFLSKLKEEGDGFHVPRDYFKSLPDEVMKKVGLQKAPQAIPQRAKTSWLDEFINSIQVLFQPQYAYALASVAVLLVAGFFLIDGADGNEQFADNDELSVQEIQEYISNNIDDFDEDLLLNSDLSFEEGNAVDENSEGDDYLDEMIEDMDLDELEELL